VHNVSKAATAIQSGSGRQSSASIQSQILAIVRIVMHAANTHAVWENPARSLPEDQKLVKGAG